MPNLLSLPRELRDLIYHEVYHGQTSMIPAPGRRQDLTQGLDPPRRLRRSSLDAELEGLFSHGAPSDQAFGTATAKESTELDFYEGEAAVRYSLAEPIPPTASLLGTNRQLRAEMREMISRRSIRYTVRIAYREYLGFLYPTWISLPARVSHVDILDVQLRCRHTKTPSIFSTESTGSENGLGSGDIFLGGMVLLQRFLERGPFLLGRKRKTKVTVDRMVLSIESKDFQSDQEAEEYHSHTVEWFDDLFWPDEPRFPEDPSSSRRDELLPLFAECIRVFECRQGHVSKEWSMGEVGKAVERRLARRMGS